MTQSQYQAQQLNVLLETVQTRRTSGTLHIIASVKPDCPTRSCILVLQKGDITYAGSAISHIPTFAQKLVQQFNPAWRETAIKFVAEKVTHPTSARQFLESLCQIRALTWEQIESFCQTQATIALEQVMPYAGKVQYSPDVEFDLSYGEDCHGLDWSQLKQAVTRRQEEWASLAPLIPSMEAVPFLAENALEKISDRAAREHLQQWVDGKRSLVEIAENLNKDSLQIARSYLTYVQAGWVVFNRSKPTNNKELPTILSVDDSPIVQTLIERTLGDRYNVLLASKAIDALNILNSKPIQLLLLDVTMPDIDGLEMCRTVRRISKFRDLPIVMLTARDTLIDRMKGQIAGTNRYLTKPFDAEKLLSVVSDFLGNRNS